MLCGNLWPIQGLSSEARMDVTPAGRRALDKAMDTARKDSLLSWREVATRAKISYEAIRNLRAGTGGVEELTLRKIDVALGWEKGTAEAVLAVHGGSAGDERVLAQFPLARESLKSVPPLCESGSA